MSVRLAWLCLLLATLLVQPAEALTISLAQHLAGPDFQFLREINLANFPTAPATINVSAAPVTYLSDRGMHVQAEINIPSPVDTNAGSITSTAVFTLQTSHNVATYTGVITFSETLNGQAIESEADRSGRWTSRMFMRRTTP
jgi:hypothetical protein